jgi:hypothetical protein
MNNKMEKPAGSAHSDLPQDDFWTVSPTDAAAGAKATMHLRATASAAMVNRTHRVVRERAKTMQDRRSKFRSLAIPLSVCAGLFVAVVFAAWTVLDQYELAVDAIPDSSQGMIVLMMWCLPLSLVVMSVVWFTRPGSGSESKFGSRMDGNSR